jgi:hypothetical protein
MRLQSFEIVETSQSKAYVSILKAETVKVKDSDTYLTVKAQFVDWNGEHFGFGQHSITIMPYEGTKKITDLALFPLIYHSDVVGVQQRCISRGLRWEALCGYHFKHYNNSAGGHGTGHIDTRVVIDTNAHNASPYNSPVNAECLEKSENGYTPPPLDVGTQPVGTGSLSLVPHSKASSTSNMSRGRSSLTWYQLLLASPSIQGFSLKDKKWLQMHVDHIKEITWNEEAFPSLILAFAQSQLKSNQSFGDVIKGKGKGVIVLILLVSHTALRLFARTNTVIYRAGLQEWAKLSQQKL